MYMYIHVHVGHTTKIQQKRPHKGLMTVLTVYILIPETDTITG